MNQKIVLQSKQWNNIVIRYTIYKLDPKDSTKEIIMKTGIYETLNPLFEQYLTRLVDTDCILCSTSAYNEQQTYYELAKTKLNLSNNISDYVYVKYSKDTSVGCCHQCSGSRIVCKICNNEYVCQICHNENEDHEFEFLEIRCNYCNSAHKKMSKKCPQCSEFFCNAYCEKCYWASNYDNFISSQQHVCPNEDITCAICQEPIHYSKYTSLDCTHCFHTACLAIARINETLNCPLCRGNIQKHYNVDYIIYQLQKPNINKIVKINCRECGKITYDYQGCFNICMSCKSSNCTSQLISSDDPQIKDQQNILQNAHNAPTSVNDILIELDNEYIQLFNQIMNEEYHTEQLSQQTQLNIALQIKYLVDNNLQIKPSMFLHNINIHDES